MKKQVTSRIKLHTAKMVGNIIQGKQRLNKNF